MKVSIIPGDKKEYAIFLQCLDDGEVAIKRGLIVLNGLFGKENEMDPDGLAGHRAQATRTGRAPKASRKVLESGCFAGLLVISPVILLP